MRQNKKKSAKRSRVKSDYQYETRLELSPGSTACPPSVFNTLSKGQKQQDTYTIMMEQDLLVTSSSTGVVNDVLNNDPSAASNWGSLVTTFDEYRILALDIHFSPFQFNGAAVIQSGFITAIDYDTFGPLGSYSAGAAYASAIEHGGGQDWRRRIYMSGVENSGFSPTSVTNATFCLKVYSDSNTVSSKLGRYLIKYIVQFRGKGL